MGPAREPVQVDPRRLRDPPDGCSLPGLTGFGGSHRAGLEPAVAPARRATPRRQLVAEPPDAIASALDCQRDPQSKNPPRRRGPQRGAPHVRPRGNIDARPIRMARLKIGAPRCGPRRLPVIPPLALRLDVRASLRPSTRVRRLREPAAGPPPRPMVCAFARSTSRRDPPSTREPVRSSEQRLVGGKPRREAGRNATRRF